MGKKKRCEHKKTFVYGKTRSASLKGSTLSALLSILFIINIPHASWIFILSCIPYLLDFLLIASYPKSLDTKNIQPQKRTITKNIFKLFLSDIKKRKGLRRLLIQNGIFESIIDSTKNYIQPILQATIMSSLSVQHFLPTIFNCIYILLIAILFALSLFIQYSIFVILAFLFIYLFRNFRKPLFINIIDDYMNKNERATVLSIASQLKSLYIILLAPLAGFIADTLGIQYTMVVNGVLLLLLYPLSFIQKKTP